MQLAQVTADYRAAASVAACHILQASKLWQRAAKIAAYYALDHEFSAAPIIKAIQATKLCYLPVVLSPQQELGFARYLPDTPLRRNDWQICEPQDSGVLLSAHDLDLILVPLLAFDRQGSRLGYGGGYYDRTLARGVGVQHATTVGLAYAAQELAAVPQECFDMPLDYILTEQELIFCHKVG